MNFTLDIEELHETVSLLQLVLLMATLYVMVAL